MPKNYFIHGTNSSVLGLLRKTNFEIASPIDLMRDYRVGPMTGELNMGGYTIHHHKNNTSFYRLFDGGCLEKVTGTYTDFPTASKSDTEKELFHVLKTSHKYGFSNINQVLFYCARARQLGIELDKSPFKEAIDNFLTYSQAYEQFLYLFKLIGIHIFPDNEKFNALPEQAKKAKGFGNDFEDVIYSELTMESLLDKIRVSNLDIKSVAEKPSEEGLQKILYLLALPLKPRTHSEHWLISEKAVDLGGETQFFTTKKNSINHEATCSNNARYLFEGLITNGHYRIETFLSKTFGESGGLSELLPKLKRDTTKKLNKMSDLVDEEITHIKDRFEIFKSILTEPKETYQFQDNESKFFFNKFPIILLSNRDDLISSYHDEYRLNEDARLRLGKEINMIATDNDVHRLEILNFLHESKIRNVEVVLFSDLKAAKNHHAEVTGGIYPIPENIALLSNCVWLNKLSKTTGNMTLVALAAFATSVLMAASFGTILPIYIGISIFALTAIPYVSIQVYKRCNQYSGMVDSITEVSDMSALSTSTEEELSEQNLQDLNPVIPTLVDTHSQSKANPSTLGIFRPAERTAENDGSTIELVQ